MKNVNDDDIKLAVRDSKSMAECLKYLRLSDQRYNRKFLSDAFIRMNLDISHFGNIKRFIKIENVDNIFVKDSGFSRLTVKRKIIKLKLLKYECAICNLSEWRGQKLSLQLDHINGINNDHRIVNLRFLCPNCHSQTPTFSGKNNRVDKRCSKCDRAISKQACLCSDCYHKSTVKIDWPSPEELLEKLNTMSFKQLSKELGVSDNSIRKYLKRTGRV